MLNKDGTLQSECSSKCLSYVTGVIPTNPQHVRVTASTSKSITLSWEPPASNCNTSCVYTVMLWKGDNKASLVSNVSNHQKIMFLPFYGMAMSI